MDVLEIEIDPGVDDDGNVGGTCRLARSANALDGVLDRTDRHRRV